MMTNDEMRTLFREELGTAFVVFQGEMHTAIQTAVQASEERLGQRIDQMQQSILELKGNVALLDQKVDALDHKVNVLDSRVGVLEHKVEQISSVLDETTVKIADMQQTMFNLENKVDTYHATVKQDMLRADAAMRTLSQQVSDLNQRLTTHIATPWNKAHPDPNSAA